jgi:hypothetical protein
MPKLGRRLARDEPLIKTRLLDLIPEDRPGSKFNELVQAAKAISISKPTLWRHLTRFEDLGVVIHEGKFYRRNPLHSGPLQLFALKTTVWGAAGEVWKERYQEVDDRWFRSLAGADWWGRKDIELCREAAAKVDLSDPDRLFKLVYSTVVEALLGYLLVLNAVRHLSDFSQAREIANILMDAEIKRPLLESARLVWEKREVVALEGLIGREIKLTIGRAPIPGEGSSRFTVLVDRSDPVARRAAPDCEGTTLSRST